MKALRYLIMENKRNNTDPSSLICNKSTSTENTQSHIFLSPYFTSSYATQVTSDVISSNITPYETQINACLPIPST